MDIQAKHGTTVFYNGNTKTGRGNNSNWKRLIKGNPYTIRITKVYDYHTDVFLQEFSHRLEFNSCWFDDLKEDYQI